MVLISLGCSTLPLIRTFYSLMLNKEVPSTVFKVFGMTQIGIEPRSSGSLAKDLTREPKEKREDESDRDTNWRQSAWYSDWMT